MIKHERILHKQWVTTSTLESDTEDFETKKRKKARKDFHDNEDENAQPETESIQNVSIKKSHRCHPIYQQHHLSCQPHPTALTTNSKVKLVNSENTLDKVINVRNDI